MIQEKLKSFVGATVALIFTWVPARFPQTAQFLTPEIQALVVGAIVGVVVHQVPNTPTA